MIDGFNVKDQALGTGDENEYTFDFKIYEAADLLLYIQDDSGDVVSKFRGDDPDYVSSLIFDSIDGGGTITLVDDLGEEYVLTMLLAADLPNQPTAFPNKASFTLDVLEGVLDFVVTRLQRVAYLAQRSMVLHDMDDIDSFDPGLPKDAASNPTATIVVNEDGDGFEWGPTTDQIQNVVEYAEAAQEAAVEAAASAVTAVAAAESVVGNALCALVVGSRAVPQNVLAAGIIPASGQLTPEVRFIQGSPGAVTAGSIAVGTTVGQQLILIGRSDVNTVTIPNGVNTSQNGDITLDEDGMIHYIWDGTNWSELSRR